MRHKSKNSADFPITVHQNEHTDSFNAVQSRKDLYIKSNTPLTKKRTKKNKKKSTLEKSTIFLACQDQVSTHIWESSINFKNRIAYIYTINQEIRFMKNLPSHINILPIDFSSIAIYLHSAANFSNKEIVDQGEFFSILSC